MNDPERPKEPYYIKMPYTHKGEDYMIFKVFYQDTLEETPVRERTNALYMEASTEEEIRKKLAERRYNIEFVTPLSEEALQYEKDNNEDFHVENL